MAIHDVLACDVITMAVAPASPAHAATRDFPVCPQPEKQGNHGAAEHTSGNTAQHSLRTYLSVSDCHRARNPSKQTEYIYVSDLLVDHAGALDCANGGQHLERAPDCFAVGDQKSHDQIAAQGIQEIPQVMDQLIHPHPLERKDGQRRYRPEHHHLIHGVESPGKLASP